MYIPSGEGAAWRGNAPGLSETAAKLLVGPSERTSLAIPSREVPSRQLDGKRPVRRSGPSSFAGYRNLPKSKFTALSLPNSSRSSCWLPVCWRRDFASGFSKLNQSGPQASPGED